MVTMRTGLCILALLVAAACGGGGGGDGGMSAAPPAPAFTDPVSYSSAADASLPGAAEITSVTRSQVVIGGAAVNYAATTGHLTASSLGTGAPQASFFYVAYAIEGASAASRPVTFFYNGGPGSSSVYLHLGSFGPKRLAANAPSTTVAVPFPLVDNAESLLDVSDLVFVDAVGTGYSQAIAPNTNRAFWGVDSDARVFRDFVMSYVVKNNRGVSPKFLFGESYGAPRSAIVARLMATAGMPLAGIVLQSSALDYNSNCGIADLPAVPCAGHLPSYGASGAFYNLDNPNPQPQDLPAFLAQVKVLASTQFEPAVRRFIAAGTAPDAALFTQLANATGLAIDKWQARLNAGPAYYRSNLMPGTLIGRYDSRVSAPQGSALARDDDPSITFIQGSFASAIAPYLSSTLRYTAPSSYVLGNNSIDTWDFSHGGRGLPDTVPDIAAALALAPAMKVLSVGGYHDLATPFFLTDTDLARLGANANVVSRYYDGGHMTYLDDRSRMLQKADFVPFFRVAGAVKAADVPAAGTPATVVAPMPPVESAPATIGPALRDPWVPPTVAKALVAVPASTRGAALRAQAESRLKESFDEADRGGSGALTREQARAAGLGFVAEHFDAIDQHAAGVVRFEDLLRFLRERGTK
jgi:carboxypeptidase C (cathepsin A)